MTQYLNLKKRNCKNCYKCIRYCPVKSIRFSSGRAYIIEDACILCGQCFVVCPQDAKLIRDDVEKAKQLIRDEAKVVVSLAPSFVANYEGATISAMKKALQKLGFYDVEETAVGATIVKTEYEKILEKREKQVVISSCCHSVNLLIQKHYPEVLPYLAPVVSPMMAHCTDIKARLEGAKTVFIGPCISKKAEAETYGGVVDCVLTFEELTKWLEGEGITIQADAEAQNAHTKARLFPVAGGIIKTMNMQKDWAYESFSVDGVDNCMSVLKDLAQEKLGPCFIEMSACTGSCTGGPVMDKAPSPVKNYCNVCRYAGEQDFPLQPLTTEQTKRHHPYILLNRNMPGARHIQDILKQMGKTLPEHELNCGTCGYDTCRDKAIAVYQGKAELSMCLPFIKDRAETFSDTIIKNTPNAIIVTNDDLEIQQINESALRLLGIKNQADVIGEHVIRILDIENFLEVQNTMTKVQKQKYMAEYSKHVEQTIVYDKDYRIFICIMRDVTDFETEREENEKLSRHTIAIADQVVEKQMRVVQEIALLLGETTAETKIALTKLKESLKHE